MTSDVKEYTKDLPLTELKLGKRRIIGRRRFDPLRLVRVAIQ